ncbi:T9SS type A sorting domain-containing protein [Kordia jejudonensis]|uniref:T9SS type A sorting domain-containing protein n=1 Tax=Kordia jejudonensis TaxID=1348245 RepID=UPI0006295C71|nr:T9SS type A sorting domain-containing protein [Kordia jejudonensis]
MSIKNISTYILFLIFTNSVVAQLVIKNNNYLYVNNQLLHVEEDINLMNSDSRILLRDESQLTQRSEDIANKGVGELSIYQEGTVGEYEYNYWCSPISQKIISNTNNNFGISLLNDVIDNLTSIPATYIHNSDYNGTSNPLNIEPYWIYKFITSNQYSQWISVQENTTINPGEGFTMKGVSGTSANNSGDNQRYDFRGKPNNGTIQNAVLANNWTLVGNPYPSALDARDYIWDTDNINAITGTLYFWEQDKTVNSHYIADYVGGYATYTINESGNVETFIPATFNSYNSDGSLNTVGSPSASGKQVFRYMAIGQGFMVEGKIGTTGIVTTRNSHREFYKESGTNSDFFRPSTSETNENLTVLPYAYKRFRINVDFNNIYTRQLVQTFHPTATAGFDYGLESKSPEDVASDAYWELNGVPYTAQAFPFDSQLEIPLIINLSEQKSITIRAFDIQNFDSNQPIFIYDTHNNTYVDLRIQDYNINLPQGTYDERFKIRFVSETLNLESVPLDSFHIFQNNNISQLTILNPNQLDIKDVSILDMTGKLVFHKSNLPKQDSYSFNTKNFSAGIYITKILIENSSISQTKKIIIKN